ncbi:hypothetical protein [Laribacter hongkongensis]|uniref:Uncharacterized protein n=1 Tax=Laribacter hongkongensis TaxID=168471 RepID=A0ABD4STG0_9NEIS|nr:hypothetical protein [Laribacter hongkongensis]MCG9027070.1 hypothetical protein [Laribacter hongkongensis]
MASEHSTNNKINNFTKKPQEQLFSYINYSPTKRTQFTPCSESCNVYAFIQNQEKDDDDIDEWFRIINTMTVDFSKAKEESKLSKLFKDVGMGRWNKTFLQIDSAVTSYLSESTVNKHIKPISDESAQFLLYLVPYFSKHDPSVSIDADTGYFNATFKSHDKGLMTILISDRNELYYSLAERGRKIVKISGSAKIKDPHDLIKFNKVLSML